MDDESDQSMHNKVTEHECAGNKWGEFYKMLPPKNAGYTMVGMGVNFKKGQIYNFIGAASHEGKTTHWSHR